MVRYPKQITASLDSKIADLNLDQIQAEKTLFVILVACYGCISICPTFTEVTI